MSYSRLWLGVFVAVSSWIGQGAAAQSTKSALPSPDFSITSNLVFLDVTVLDKKGQPVVQGLTKEDFTITDDNKAERIFSFEAPEVHKSQRHAGEQNAE